MATHCVYSAVGSIDLRVSRIVIGDSLKLPVGPPESRRVEHRVTGADANPHLVAAAVLAGMHHGITNRLEPGPATTANAYEKVAPSLPRTWEDTLDAFKGAQVLVDYMEPQYMHVYHATKDEERRLVGRAIPPLEHDWYLAIGA